MTKKTDDRVAMTKTDRYQTAHANVQKDDVKVWKQAGWTVDAEKPSTT